MGCLQLHFVFMVSDNTTMMMTVVAPFFVRFGFHIVLWKQVCTESLLTAGEQKRPADYGQGKEKTK